MYSGTLNRLHLQRCQPVAPSSSFTAGSHGEALPEFHPLRIQLGRGYLVGRLPNGSNT